MTHIKLEKLVKMGQKNVIKSVQTISLNQKDIKIHEHWNSNNYAQNGNNIALVRLSEEAITCNENPDNPILPIPVDWNQGIAIA